MGSLLRKIAEFLGADKNTPLRPGDMERVALVSPHMDDDVLGCGGLLALRAKMGLPGPAIIYLSDGTRGTPTLERDPSLGAVRKRESKEALETLGVRDARQVFLDLPDNEVKADKAAARRLAGELAGAGPRWLLANCPWDSHPDHRAASKLLAMALGEPGLTKLSPRILLYEVYAALPACQAVDITGVAELKRKAIRRHQTQLLLHPYDEYVLGLNRFRGLQVARLGEGVIRWGEGYLEVGITQFVELSRSAG